MAIENERRRSERRPLVTEVNYEGAAVNAQNRITDIGLEGVFIDTIAPLPPGSRLRLSFAAPDGHEIAAEGEVVHSHPSFRMGVRFKSLDADDAERIRKIVAA